MAFFVMLLTMATTRSGKLCETGTGVFERSIQGFRESIATFGVPGMLGERKSLGFERTMHRFAVEGANEETNGQRLIDADEERASGSSGSSRLAPWRHRRRSGVRRLCVTLLPSCSAATPVSFAQKTNATWPASAPT